MLAYVLFEFRREDFRERLPQPRARVPGLQWIRQFTKRTRPV